MKIPTLVPPAELIFVNSLLPFSYCNCLHRVAAAYWLWSFRVPPLEGLLFMSETMAV